MRRSAPGTASAALLLGAAALLLVGAVLGGCAPSKAAVAAQDRDTCFAHMRELKTAVDLVNADTGVYPDLASAQKELPDAKCPDGGTYKFDPATDTISCSIHGPLQAAK